MDLEYVTHHTVAKTHIPKSGNVGGVLLQNFSVAIDSTNSLKTGSVFLHKLEQYCGLPVKYLIITHYHSDHTGCVRPRRKGSSQDVLEDISIVTSEATAKNMPKSFRKLPLCTFEDTFTIEDSDLSIEICHTGGHTSGSSVIYVPHEKVVFAGDLIIQDSFPWGADTTCDPDLWIRALEYLESLDVEKIVPGHGPVLTRDELEKHTTFLKDLRSTIQDAVRENNPPATIGILQHYFELFPDLEQTNLADRRGRPTVAHWYKFYKSKKL